MKKNCIQVQRNKCPNNYVFGIVYKDYLLHLLLTHPEAANHTTEINYTKN